MQRLIFVVLLITGTASLCMAQTSDDPKNEFFGGYSFHSADINTLTVDPRRTSQNGANLEYTRNVRKNIGLTFDASAHFHRESNAISGGTFSRQRDQYFFLGGVQFKNHNEGRLQPFAHVLAGASVFHGLTSSIRTSGNVYTFDDATAFAMAFGGGVDIRAGKRIDIRLFQADYTPTHFGPGWQNNFRLSVGIVFKR